MDQIAYLPLGARTNGKIVKINQEKSAKMGLYSAILSFAVETAGKLGGSWANRGFFGIMLTEKRADSIGLKVGDNVSCQIVSYRTALFNGVENTAAQVVFIDVAEPVRVQLEQPLTEKAGK